MLSSEKLESLHILSSLLFEENVNNVYIPDMTSMKWINYVHNYS